MMYWAQSRWTPSGDPWVPARPPVPTGREAHAAPSDLCARYGAWVRIMEVATGDGGMKTVAVGHVAVA